MPHETPKEIGIESEKLLRSHAAALRMSPPERPGHGLAFRPEILKDHRIGGQRIKG